MFERREYNRGFLIQPRKTINIALKNCEKFTDNHQNNPRLAYSRVISYQHLTLITKILGS